MTDGTEKCNPKIEENQREDRRAFRKFIVLLLAAMVVGGITGAFSTMAAKGQADIGAGITAGLQKIAPYANLVIAAALAVWMTGMLRGARAEYKRWDGEEERVDRKDRAETGYWCDCHESWRSLPDFSFLQGSESSINALHSTLAIFHLYGFSRVFVSNSSIRRFCLFLLFLRGVLLDRIRTVEFDHIE